MSKVDEIMALADNYAEEASMSDRSREPSHERERVEREKLRKAIEALEQPSTNH